MKKYVAEKRDEERVLIGLAETGLRDCVPHLNVGDAFELLGTPSLTVPSGQDANGNAGGGANEETVAARQELIDVLSGNAMLMNGEGEVEEQGQVLQMFRRSASSLPERRG